VAEEAEVSAEEKEEKFKLPKRSFSVEFWVRWFLLSSRRCFA